MRTIHTDLALRTHDNRIRLPIRQIMHLRVCEGDRVRISGGGIEVEASVEVRLGAPLGRVDWATLVYTDAEDGDADEETA